jgi:site-specific DNA-methyltransferase (adenine-specific)
MTALLPVLEDDSASSVPQTRALADGKLVAGLILDDAVSGLRSLPPDVFNVVVTSPPYYWARDYEVDGQIGHEDTVDEYVEHLADVFDQVRRVLHPEGVFYLNIGDTYYSGNGQPHGSDPRSPSRNFIRRKLRPVDRSGWGIPKKSMIGVPWKVAFELQRRGWTLRSDIIWNRMNAFVEPTARDRPYRQYEHLFLFSKQRFYSFDRSALGGDEDVWDIPIERGRRVEHNAVFPTQLVRRCIMTGSPPGGHVLDPFVGSGTTSRVANDLGRNSVGIDLNPGFVEGVARDLLSVGYEASDWSRVLSALETTPEQWDSWAGNLRNFRKPRTQPRHLEAP